MLLKNKKYFERKQAVQAQHDCDRWLNMLAKGSPAGLLFRKQKITINTVQSV